ncbi:hypothetical protein EZJ19_12335 [Parasulfuritortus cantonensis]|uniref:Uncharacterized protein n=1 Tax=Parasulfuritortus cantonensis TaxID=2528202 RepID=A0A4R1B2M8_9PROT|nr:baseplate J/gp47 family protein [Parasulfuritortus cantonensis]TCJ12322.1 hypothetical protein EZJ19_12335 [Parasulfuritortus cantonensis]
MTDLTRWNRAGLARFDYLDGNAALFLERLRAGLAAQFPAWPPAQAALPAGGETAEQRRARIEDLYATDPDDMLWQLTRQFARACHVLGGHLDAYANEAYLGTASQWDNLRRLVALLDYAPRPPASAGTPLALFVKAGLAGSVAAGLQVKYSPAKGSPVVFETLADLDADSACNTLYARDRLRNPQALSGDGHSLVLAGRLDKLKSGEPVVLEDERSGALSAHQVQGILLGDETTTLTVTPPVPAGYAKGWTRVHGQAREKLAPLGPATTGVDAVGHALQLAVPAAGLAAGDIVVIASGDDKPYYRRIKSAAGQRLVFHRPVGQLTLTGATVARALTVPLSDLREPPDGRTTETPPGSVLDVVYAAGDWSRLAGLWLADIRTVAGREYLPMYRCLHAKYVPVTNTRIAADERPGYTALTLTWHPDSDDVPGTADLRLANPQALLAPPPTPGAWPVDRFLNKSADGHLVRELVTEAGKQTGAGDLAVLAKGNQLAWARLATVALDLEHGEATLGAAGTWQDRGGGPFFLAASRLYSHFALVARALGWQDNATPLNGRRVVPESLPAGLKAGRAVLAGNGTATRETVLARLAPDRSWFDLGDDLPAGTTCGNLRIHANVVAAGHGESRPARVLGSGDGTLSNQRFTLAVADLAYVADAGMSAGVRAALAVTVAGETWTQVASLKDSGPSAAHYQVRVDQDGHAEVQFGDGRHGRRLPSGGNNVRVAFRQGAGAAGNLAAGSFAKPAKPHSLVETVAQPIAASGGADREANADLRVEAPATLLALDRAVSLADYAKLARGHASVWQARAFRRPPGLGQRERIEVVVMAAGGGTLSAPLKQDLRDYLAARAQPGVALAVTDYQRLGFRLAVTLRVRSDAYDVQAVREAVADALAAAFSEQVRQLGQVLYRGEVYQVVDGVAGVENSDCAIALSAAPAGATPARVAQVDGAALTATPGAGQCLVLDQADILVKEYGL